MARLATSPVSAIVPTLAVAIRIGAIMALVIQRVPRWDRPNRVFVSKTVGLNAATTETKYPIPLLGGPCVDKAPLGVALQLGP